MFIYYLYQGRTQQEVSNTVHSAQLANTVHLQRILLRYLALLDLFHLAEMLSVLHVLMGGNVQMLMGLAMQGVFL